MERGGTDHKVLSDFNPAGPDRLARKKEGIAGRIEACQLQMILMHIDLQMFPRDLGIPGDGER